MPPLDPARPDDAGSAPATLTSLPRLEPPALDRLDEAQRRAAARIASGPRKGVRGPLALWLHSPEFAERAQHLGEFLRFGTCLSPRLSELAILVVARHWSTPYVWCVHAPIAIREGLDPAFVDRLARDPAALPEGADERTIAQWCRSVLANGRPDPASLRQVIERFGERGCVELAGIAGYYSLGAFTLACADLPLPDGAAPPF
jgi:4-carboxymuconolactone decarboxylase